MANTPPSGTQFAIPNFNYTTNTLLVNGEPGKWQCDASNQAFSYMNGTYYTSGSHFFTGGVTVYSSYNCFGQNGIAPTDVNGYHYGPCWESRSGSNNYASSGVYQGSTSTIVSGSPVLGEYVSITAPYGIVLKSYSLISSNYNAVSNGASGWVIAGSNNGGTTYTTVDVVTNNPLPNDGYGLFNTTNIISYTTYIIIITNSPGGGAANIGTWNIYSPALINPTCFKRDMKILCIKDNFEQYKLVQDLRKGDLIKTCYDGYKRIDMICRNYIYNSGDTIRVKDRLYKYTKDKYPELLDDLIITGTHAILVDELSDKEKIRTIDLFGKIYITDKKYRLMGVVNDKAEPYDSEGTFEIWHFSLEHEDEYMNYGIYANGLLVETCSKQFLKQLSGMEVIEN